MVESDPRAITALDDTGAGVLLVSLRGSNVDLLHILFGTVLALDDAALRDRAAGGAGAAGA